MRYGVTYNGLAGVVMNFDNGWSLTIAELPCGHVSLVVCPSYLEEDHRIAWGSNMTDAEMIKRGDRVIHFKGNDGELLDFIVGVASRPTEPHLAEINKQIEKAVKS